ncbi:MAG: ATP-binding protein [Bacteroidota bacterium]
MKFKGVSIRAKLIRLISTISAISLSIVFAALFVYEIVSYRENSIREMNVLANILAANSTAALAFNDAEAGHEILSAVKSEPLITAAILFSADGKILTGFIADSTETTIPVGPADYDFEIRAGNIEGFVPVMLGEKKIGTLYIRRSTEDTQRRLLLYAFIAGSVIIVSFTLTYFLSNRLERTISNPLISLSNLSRQISEQHDYSVRASDAADGEIGQLNEAFNTMLAKIEIQNNEIQKHNQELEFRIEERTKAYRQEKEFAEVVVNSSLVLIAVLDPEMRFIGYNDKCEEEFGLKREQVLGKKFDEVMPQIKGTLTYNSLLRALNGEYVHNPQYRSGVTGAFYESFMRPLRNENNEIYAALMTAHNINAFVEANAELQKRNSDLEQFAYVASHDLQEPLRKVLLFTDRLNEELTNKNEAVVRYIDKIDQAARRMSNLIRDVLAYSRLSQLEGSFVATDLNDVLAQIRIDLELYIEEKKATITSQRLPVVMGNTLQLNQLFSNLINNALKFSDKNPIVEITCALASREEVISQNLPDVSLTYAKIQVIDYGVGFDPRHSEKIFTLFQRLHQDKKYEGTGIGLALCKKIVANHHGSIGVNSIPGAGSTFTIFLPINPI